MRKIGLAFAVAAAVHSADAQGVRVMRGGIPRGHLPPPGMCRVWYDNLPPGRQPPATTCARAEREAWRSGGRVIYGERWNDRDDRRDDRAQRERDRDHDRRRDRDCAYSDRRNNDCDWRDERCRDQDRNRRCDRDARRSRGALDELLGGVINGRVRRQDGVRFGPGSGSRAELNDSIPGGVR